MKLEIVSLELFLNPRHRGWTEHYLETSVKLATF